MVGKVRSGSFRCVAAISIKKDPQTGRPKWWWDITHKKERERNKTIDTRPAISINFDVGN